MSRNETIQRLMGIPRPGSMVADEKGELFKVLYTCRCDDRMCILRPTSPHDIRVENGYGYWYWEDWIACTESGWSIVGNGDDFEKFDRKWERLPK